MEPEQNTNNAPVSGAPMTVEKNKLMAILSYISVLVIIPFLTAKDDAFVAFHIKQGLVLLVIAIAAWVVASMLWILWPIAQVVNFAALVLAIIGIVNAAQGKEKELPLVGSYAKYFKF
ncbi:MAG: hypothetical protein AAB439_03055 [Patescibacteria group bacterium]